MTMESQIDANQAVLELAASIEPKRSLYGDVWHILRRRKLAMISLVILALYILTALLAFTGLLDKRIELSVGDSNAPPALHDSAGQIRPALFFGTDFLGRSVLWRFLYGARVALTVAVLASIITEVIGVLLGLIAGYFGGWIDDLIIWLFSTVNSVPYILLLMAFAFVLRNQSWRPFLFLGIEKSFSLAGIPTIILALGLTSWVGICRLIRGEVLRLRDRDYVAAARAVGVGTPRLLRKHILPNVFHLIIIDFSLGLGAFVQAEVILSFLGLGVTDQPSWGRMIDDAKLELLKGVWWQLAAATIAIFVFSLAVNIFGDALRDALDPRVRQ
jgi:ABC-type dipeptide/oligopeptide/nickel transport system permease subunit